VDVRARDLRSVRFDDFPGVAVEFDDEHVAATVIVDDLRAIRQRTRQYTFPDEVPAIVEFDQYIRRLQTSETSLVSRR
jgi:hypothetical protein